jgi:hypothetical protein
LLTTKFVGCTEYWKKTGIRKYKTYRHSSRVVRTLEVRMVISAHIIAAKYYYRFERSVLVLTPRDRLTQKP